MSKYYKMNCSDCKFKERPKDKFPCEKCKEQGYVPLTCYDCRSWCNKKGIRTCSKFEWD
jgi:hypothetical protein